MTTAITMTSVRIIRYKIKRKAVKGNDNNINKSKNSNNNDYRRWNKKQKK